MSAVILAFPRPSPVRALCPTGGALAPFTAAWCEQRLPLGRKIPADHLILKYNRRRVARRQYERVAKLRRAV